MKQFEALTRKDSQPVRYLIVDDSVFARKSLAKMVESFGGRLAGEAGDGCTAVDLFRSHQESIDVILLDATIPGSSSREVMAEVRRIRPDIKVILTSAYSGEAVMPSLDAQCTSAFIRKPFSLADLMEVVRNTLAS